MAEAAGVDGISIVVGWHESNRGALGRDVPTDGWLRLARAAKEVVKVPLAFGPRFGDPKLAEVALAKGEIDFWEVCRPMLADPLIVHKLAHGAQEDIRPCLGGLVCLSRMFRNLPYICTMNPRLGHEYEPELAMAPASVQRKVLVIGGGPGGMEAALTSARRGHAVELWERSPRLGGQLHAAAREVGGGKVFLQLIDYYRRQLARAGVTVKLGTEADGRAVSAFAPDVCIVATGAEVVVDPVAHEAPAGVEVWHADAPEDPPSGRRVVVMGADRSALVAAEGLAQAGREVTMLAGRRKVAWNVAPTFKWRHAAWVKEFGIKVLRGAWADRWNEDGTLALGWAEGFEPGAASLPVDLLVAAGDRGSRQKLVADLEYRVDVLHVVGDAVTPQTVCQAVHGAYRTAVHV